jgi:hypothetical protein
MEAVVWYDTAHGYGHAVRSGRVLAEIGRRAPGLALSGARRGAALAVSR